VPLQAYSVAVDPHNGRRVYACTAGPGMLFSDDGARMWHVGMQPGRESVPCEVLIDPRSSRVIYSLDRHGKVYRSTDAGMHWMLRSAFGYISGQMLTSLTILRGTLYVTANKGLYTSTDGGTHWRLVKPEPITDGSMLQSIRGAGGWITAVANRQGTPPEGLYVARDGQRWQVAAFTDLRGPKYFGALDLAAYGDSATRMWEDHTARIVFTAGGLGGLYRWSSGL
jgi:hypothetical protein